jgi:hypothetical protein
MTTKNPAAVELGRKRWEGTTKKARKRAHDEDRQTSSQKITCDLVSFYLPRGDEACRAKSPVVVYYNLHGELRHDLIHTNIFPFTLRPARNSTNTFR